MSLSTALNRSKPIGLEGKFISLEVMSLFHKQMFEKSANRIIIEDSIYEMLGIRLHIKPVLGTTKLTKKQIENVSEVDNQDLVQAAQEIFGM